MPGLNGEFIPDPFLAQSNFHHRTVGSSHRNLPDTPENLHRPMHEFMTDEELRAYVLKDIASVREEHAKIGGPEDDERFRRIFRLICDESLLPNLRYLEVIKRLPEGVNATALEVEFLSSRLFTE